MINYLPLPPGIRIGFEHFERGTAESCDFVEGKTLICESVFKRQKQSSSLDLLSPVQTKDSMSNNLRCATMFTWIRTVLQHLAKEQSTLRASYTPLSFPQQRVRRDTPVGRNNTKNAHKNSTHLVHASLQNTLMHPPL